MWVQSLYIIIYTLSTITNAQKFEGSRCDNGGRAGRCALLPHCAEALKAVKKFHKHPYERCGFDNFTEIVCCPSEDVNDYDEDEDEVNQNFRHFNDTSKPRSTSDVRPTVRFCQKYADEMVDRINLNVLGGEDAEPGEFPHMVALGYNTDEGVLYECGGSLISTNHVLTAAHCLSTPKRPPPIIVRLGATIIRGPRLANATIQPKDFTIAKIIVHPDYQKRNHRNDIGLIRLDKQIIPSAYQHPACLYDKPDDPIGLIVTGWGYTDLNKNLSDVLQRADVRPAPLNECNATYITRTRKSIGEEQICAWSNTSDTCIGDSGGPLQIQTRIGSGIHSIVGITSYGLGCGGLYPSVYTRVYSYLDWIERNVWPVDD